MAEIKKCQISAFRRRSVVTGVVGWIWLQCAGLGCLWANSSKTYPPTELASEQGGGQAPLETTPAPQPTPGVLLPDFATLAQRLLPGVVAVSVEKTSPEERGMMMDMDQFPFDLFRHFNRRGQQDREMAPREEKIPGMGSGFVVESNGLIVTNAHVVENSSKIEIQFTQADGTVRTIPAKLIGSASHFDVALLKIDEPIDVPVLPLGDSDKIRVGDWVMAMGNPLGHLPQSVSVGIISAKERRGLNPSGRQGYYNYLQTDASINLGNSGGPLINLSGEVIGINSAVASNGQGIGFAIPINMVKSMLPQLKTEGKFVRSYMGVGLQPLTPELAESYGLTSPYGALVGSVNPGDPGEKAGVREGDIVLEFNGKKIKNRDDLMLYASMVGVGKKVPMVLWRNGKQLTLQVTMGAFPDDVGKASEQAGGKEKTTGKTESEEDTRWGLVVGDITPDRAEKLGLSGEQGVWVERILPDSPASRARVFRGGEIILDVQGKPVPNVAAWKRHIGEFKQSKIVRLRVQQGGNKFYIVLQK